MTWTAPMTAVANSTLTASQWNIHVRDNFNETAPAKATTAGRIFVSTGANAIAEREPITALTAANQTTTSTSYTDLGGTPGPQASVATGTRAMVWWKARCWNSTATNSVLMSIDVSGASTIAASDTIALVNTIGGTALAESQCQFHFFDTLTAGTNTFTAKYRVDASTGNFIDRRLMVIPL
ncbi:MAG TPA: hypothetical protein VGX25_03990 [Actinophytocola sp.]|uniref:hypothetical protein n=1 Tax=Actinophytocola sp. TaxID=1872138 RepID=UPI002DDDA495|nr:hypothetical protein [Actinophytocola sp.]HEV2778539.1 hypothetical protein [Actinophytocola sp.]